MVWLVKYFEISHVAVGHVADGVPQVEASGLNMLVGMSACCVYKFRILT